MTYKKLYKISPNNSTVNGSPGRRYDWSLFCWDGSEVYIMPFGRKPKPEHAPLPWVDHSYSKDGYEYMHVPYAWAEQGTIYRVRPNESMQPGKSFRSLKRIVVAVRAIKQDDGWYWEVEFERI